MAGQDFHLGLDRVLDVQRVRAGRLINADASGGLTVLREDLAIGLRAKLDATDVAQARNFSVIAGLHDDILELLDIGETALHLDRVLEIHTGRRRWRADLPRRDLEY